jgi:hypothetical protein
MTEITRACPVTILQVESSGDGSAVTAVPVELPSQHTILLVEMPIAGHQGIKLPEGNLGDVAEIFVLSGTTTGANPRLHIFDADDNQLAQTDSVGALGANESIVARKVLPTPYSIPVGYDGAFLGTWLCSAPAIRSNYSPTT